MVSKKKGHQGENLEAVEQALSRTERAIEDNQKPLTIIVIAIILVVGGFLGTKKFIIDILKPADELPSIAELIKIKIIHKKASTI